jgi:hypothetical protein
VRAPIAVMFLSTGRCGTQWLTEALRERHSDEVTVEHEPIGPLYRPRAYFRAWDDPAAILSVPEVAAHVSRISRLDHYVETGWPAFAALPLLAERLPRRLRVVHLTRHPVPTALSHLAHSSYAGSPRDDAYTRLATLGPSDPRVFHPEYAALWNGLSPYEKCLYWWTEVNEFGLEWGERCGSIPFLRVRSEDMLAGDPNVLERLVAFMGLPWDERWLSVRQMMIDRWHHRTDRAVDPLAVLDHPATIGVARRLGYDVEDVDLAALEARYRGEPHEGRDRVGRYAS